MLSLSSASHPFASCSENSVILHEVSGRTLSIGRKARVLWYTPPQQMLNVLSHVFLVVEDAATTRDTSIVEKKMDLVGLLLRGHFIAEAYYLSLIGHIHTMGCDARTLQLNGPHSHQRLVSAMLCIERSHIATLQRSLTS